MAKLSLSDLRAIREREEKNLKKRAMGTSGINAGAKLTLNTIADEVEKAGLENVIVTQAGSAAPLPEPVVEVYSPDKGLVAYGSVGVAEAKRIVSEHLVGGKVVEELKVELEN